MDLKIDRDWFQRMAELEDGHEVGAGFEICDAPPGFLQSLVDATKQRENAMTTDVIVRTNGNYVATVKQNGEDKGTVGPGNAVTKQFYVPHGSGPHVFEIEERAATPEEIEAAKAADV